MPHFRSRARTRTCGRLVVVRQDRIWLQNRPDALSHKIDMDFFRQNDPIFGGEDFVGKAGERIAC